MSRVLTRAVLVLSGALLVSIGGTLLVSPVAFLGISHVFIENDPGLLSELTAPSGLLVVCGAFMLRAAIQFRFANPALLTGAIAYGSYGVSRFAAMALHGQPPGSLIAATVVELVLAAVMIALRLGVQRQRLFRPVSEGAPV
jgi:multisubunit Na+/H+ antiporter MnhB subunit